MQIIDTRHTAVRHAVPIEEIKNEESVAAEHKDIVESSDLQVALSSRESRQHISKESSVLQQVSRSLTCNGVF